MRSIVPLSTLRPHLSPRPFLRPTPLSIRHNSTTSTLKPKSTAEPTTFSSKSSPRTTYDSPEASRGMPPPTSGYQRKRVEEPRFTSSGQGEEAFSGPSRPRLIYERPGDRDLPKVGLTLSSAGSVIALGLLGLGWGAFLLHATNAERLASSVLRQVTFQLRNSKEVISVLGENVRLVENWWALGQPWISGTINLMQGRVDLSFRVRGDKGAGTVYFTSIRPQEQGAWRIVRYKIIADDGEVVRLENLESFKTKL
ncbi:hypothetical protein L486_04016 [Kwoniella mangroviensis CBS 10435]|uniref:Mitochondrial protein n=1 Tax=Kwoniella mangroviensis CBS 10435 TaxID=1331196 RepID=A0A1B9IR11_9TREE|nr:hypothetical protein L486_04016 [Kwoniella mangroviensis CBS 10435]OCF74909.1 hypothetical protein I204_03752 [Kwoniella mangroviensis CBS 8886]